MKNILLLLFLILMTKEALGSDDKKQSCVGTDRDDKKCNAIYELGRSKTLNCAAIMRDWRCDTIPMDSAVFHTCCEGTGAKEDAIGCKRSTDKRLVICKGISDPRPVYYKIVNEVDLIVPVSGGPKQPDPGHNKYKQVEDLNGVIYKTPSGSVKE